MSYIQRTTSLPLVQKILFILLVLALSMCSLGKDPEALAGVTGTESGIIAGVLVDDDDEIIPNHPVHLLLKKAVQEKAASTTTDTNGYFEFNELRSSSYTVSYTYNNQSIVLPEVDVQEDAKVYIHATPDPNTTRVYTTPADKECDIGQTLNSDDFCEEQYSSSEYSSEEWSSEEISSENNPSVNSYSSDESSSEWYYDSSSEPYVPLYSSSEPYVPLYSSSDEIFTESL